MSKGTIMKRNIVFTLAFFFTLGLFAGCTQRIGDFTLISTKNVDIGGKYKKIARHTGSDSRPDILTIPIGTPDLKQAVDNCIEAGKGELLTNAVVDFDFWTAILYGRRTYTVTGDVWGKPDIGDLLSDPDGGIFELHAGASGFELVSMTNPANVIKVDHFASRY
jgi:hypothetical protein